MKSKFLKLLASFMLISVFAFAMVACDDAATSEKKADEEPGEEEDLGFSEVEIFAGEKWAEGYLAMNGVYFQAVTMNGGTSKEDADCHLELDVSAMKGNKFGFGEGDWVPYLTVNYEVTKDGETISSGTFMPMAASDGPHYGANIKMAGNGDYTVKFTVSYPGTDTYLIHTDETGPGAVYPTASYTFEKTWNYIFGSWEE